jgi:GLPGLI family protein
MKFLFIKILAIVMFLVVSKMNAQDFQGKAIYQTKEVVNLKMDSTQIDIKQQTAIQEMLRKQLEKVYELEFNKIESVYREQEQLEKPSAKLAGGIIVVLAGEGNNRLYKNSQTESFINSRDFMGKQFLISDSLEKLDWKLEEESKKIGDYLCFKATATQEYEDVDFKTDEIEIKNRNIIAWYTPEIPVNHGPEKYFGLPGLIMEVIAGKRMYLCSKLILNPKKRLKIKTPEKGKKVTQLEFEKIQNKKIKEMNERYSNDRKKGNENSIQIKIRG